MKDYWRQRVIDNGPECVCSKCGADTTGEIGHRCEEDGFDERLDDDQREKEGGE